MKTKFKRVFSTAMALVLAGSISYSDVTIVKAGVALDSMQRDDKGVYLIHTPDELIEFVRNAYTGIDGKLMNDITFEDNYTNDNYIEQPVENMIFDGNGYTIYNYNMEEHANSLFVVMYDSTVKNLNLEMDVSMIEESEENAYGWGGIACNAYNSTFENCTISGEINIVDAVDYSAGLVGYSQKCTYTECTNNANITSDMMVSGIVALSYADKITKCTNNGNLNGIYSTGGIVGDAYVTTVDSCENNGDIDTPQGELNNNYGGIGGIIGIADTCTITKCINRGTIGKNENKYECIGGIVSILRGKSKISECVNEGDIIDGGDVLYVGGINGLANNITRNEEVQGCETGNIDIVDCINNGKVCSNLICGGIVGYNIFNNKELFVYVDGCTNNGDICSKETAGGIAGSVAEVQITNSNNSGDVQGELYVGSICGYAFEAYVGNVYNIGSVLIGNSVVDNVVGSINATTITNAEANHVHNYTVEKNVIPAFWSLVIPGGLTKLDGKVFYVCKCGHDIGTEGVIAKAQDILLSQVAVEYKGKELAFPTVTVKDSNGKVISSDNYTVVWKNASGKEVSKITGAGNYTAHITFKNRYGGKGSVQLVVKEQATEQQTETTTEETTTVKKVTVKKSKIVKTTRTGKTKAKISFKKVSGATSYELHVSTSKKFKAKSTRKIKAKKTTQTVKKLKTGKKYYVRVRAIKKVNGVKYTSKWSTVRSLSGKVGKTSKYK